MKLYSSYIFRSFISIMIGLLLIFNPDTPIFLIEIIGALFALSGLWSITSFLLTYFKKNSVIKPVFPIAGLGSLLMGVVLGIHAEFFLQILMYVLGYIILLFGFSQLFGVFSYRKFVPLNFAVFILPVSIILIGSFVLFQYKDAALLPFRILGTCCVIYGISDLFYGFRIKHYERLNNGFTEYEDVTNEANDDSK